MEKYNNNNNKKHTRFYSLVHNLYHIVDIDISSIEMNYIPNWVENTKVWQMRTKKKSHFQCARSRKRGEKKWLYSIAAELTKC